MRDGPGHDGRAVFSAWQWLWWSSSALALIAALAVFYCVPGDPRRRVAGRLFDGVRRAWSSATVLLASTFALYSLMFFALFAFLPVLLMERMDVTYRDAGLLSALASAVNISGNLAAGWLLARGIGRGALILFASATMGAAALGIFLGLFQPLTTFLLCLLFSAAGGLIPATLLASAPLAARNRPWCLSWSVSSCREAILASSQARCWWEGDGSPWMGGRRMDRRRRSHDHWRHRARASGYAGPQRLTRNHVLWPVSATEHPVELCTGGRVGETIETAVLGRSERRAGSLPTPCGPMHRRH